MSDPVSDSVSDSMNPVIAEYVEPSTAELGARKKRNAAIALGLFGFVALIFCIMLLKMDYFK